MTDSTTVPASELGQWRQAIDLAEFRGAMAELELEDIIDELVVTFLDDAPGRMSAIESAVECAVAEEIRIAAHAYKSAAVNMYAKQLADLLTQLENTGMEENSVRAAELLPLVRTAHDATVTLLREHFE